MTLPANFSVPIVWRDRRRGDLLFRQRKLLALRRSVGVSVGSRSQPIHARPPVWLTLLIALGLGLLGALFAILLQKFAIAVAGFIAGGRAASAVLADILRHYSHYRGITFVIGGILGALLLLATVRLGADSPSSIEGAHLIETGLLPQGGAVICSSLSLSSVCSCRDRCGARTKRARLGWIERSVARPPQRKRCITNASTFGRVLMLKTRVLSRERRNTRCFTELTPVVLVTDDEVELHREKSSLAAPTRSRAPPGRDRFTASGARSHHERRIGHMRAQRRLICLDERGAAIGAARLIDGDEKRRPAPVTSIVDERLPVDVWREDESVTSANDLLENRPNASEPIDLSPREWSSSCVWATSTQEPAFG